MATLLSAYYFQVGAQVKGLETDMKRAERITESSTKRMRKKFAATAKRAAAIGAAVAGGLAVAARQSVKHADGIAKAADKIGLGTEALQEYRFAAKLAGVDQKALDMGMQRFSRRVAEVAAGTGELNKVAQQYGIQMRDTNGQMKSNNQLLSEFADVIANAESKQEALRISFKLFDSEGAALVNMLRGGSAALNEMRKEAHELGVVISDDLIRKSEGAANKMDILSSVARTKMTVALLENVDAINSVTDALVGMIDKGGEVVRFFKWFSQQTGEQMAQLAGFKTMEDQLDALLDRRAELLNTQQVRDFDNAVKAGFQAIGDFLGGRDITINDDLEEVEAKIERIRALMDDRDFVPFEGMKDDAEEAAKGIDKAAESMEGLRKITVDLSEKTASEFLDAQQKLIDSYVDLVAEANPAIKTLKNMADKQEAINELQEKGFFFSEKQTRSLLAQAAGLDAAATNQDIFNKILADATGVNIEAIEQYTKIAEAMDMIARGGPAAAKGMKMLGQAMRSGGSSSDDGGGLFDSRIGMDQAVQQSAQVAAGAIGNALGIPQGGIGSALGGIAGAFLGGPIGSAIGSLLGGAVDSLFGSGSPDHPEFNLQASQPSRSALDQSRQTPLGGIASGGVWNVDANQIRQILQAVVDFDRDMMMVIDPADYDAAARAVANFDETFKESAASAEEVMRRRFLAIMQEVEPGMAGFLESFGDLNSMLQAFEGIEQIRDIVDDADNALLALSDSLQDNITAQLARMDGKLEDSRTAFEQALASMDPTAIAQAGQQVQQQLVARYELERRLLEDLTGELEDLRASARAFALDIAERRADLDLGPGRNRARDAQLLGTAFGNMQDVRALVQAANDPGERIQHIDEFIGSVDSWLSAATNRINNQIAALETEAQEILGQGRARAQRQQQAAQRASQAAQQARQAELAAINKQLEQARAWQGILQSTKQFLDRLQFGGESPLTAQQRLSDVQGRLAGMGPAGSPEEAQRQIELLQQQMDLAGQVHQRPTAEFRRIYNDTVRQIEALRDKAKTQDEIANDLQRQANQLQQSTQGAISAGNAQNIILSREEQERLQAIRDEQEELRQEQLRVNQNADRFYAWAQDQREAAEQARTDQITAAINEVTGGLDPDAYIAQALDTLHDDLTGPGGVVPTLEAFLEEIQGWAVGDGQGGGGGGIGPGGGGDPIIPNQPAVGTKGDTIYVDATGNTDLRGLEGAMDRSFTKIARKHGRQLKQIVVRN